MITITPMLFSVLRAYDLAFINTAGPLIILGIYYGFLTTLPLAPSQLVCIRAFLLEGEGKESESPGTVAKSGILIAAISGLTVSQLAFFLSIYWPPLYMIWLKPHLLTLLVLPYMFFYWSRIQEFESSGWLKTEQSKIYDPRVRAAFLDSFLFQALNPVLLPSPVMTRLMSVFLFRYSQVSLFILGTAIGWLGGQIMFVLLSWCLLLRLERDLPTIYVIVRRLVHNIFPPIVFGLCLAYMGRSPISFFRKQTDIQQIPEISPAALWPSVVFDTTLWKRPFRLPKKDMLDNFPPLYNNKKRFSQYLFEVCVSEGKRRLSYTYPQSLLAFQSHLEDCLDVTYVSQQTDNDIYHEWATSKQNRKDQISNILFKQMEALDNGAPIETVIENKIASLTTIEQPVRKRMDPRLAKYMRYNTLSNKIESPWIKGESSSLEDTSLELQSKSNLFHLTENNYLREWISIKSEQMINTLILPWQSLEHNSNAAILTLLNNSQETNTNKEQLYTWESLVQAYKLNPKVDIYKTMPGHKKLLHYLTKQPVTKLLTQIFERDQRVDSSDIQTLLDYYKPLPVWYAQRHFTTTDIRQPRISKRLKSFDFVRRLITGSLRARRRKTLIWNALQIKPETPFLLRVQNLSKQEDMSIKQAVLVTTQQTNLYASETAKRFNFRLAHMVRGPALVIQSWFRRYVKQPILILFKNVGRLLLLQKTEWSEDIGDWTREVYIYYSYDGKQYSITERPKKWYYTGLQIRILFPFHLKPWHPSNVTADGKDQIKLQLQSDFDLVNNNSILEHSSYLTVWGSETEVPFGNVKKQSSFWKPTFKAIRLVLSRRLNKQFIKIDNMLQPVYKLVQTPLSSKFVNQTIFSQEEPIVADNMKQTREQPIHSIDKKNLLLLSHNEDHKTTTNVLSIEKSSLVLSDNRASQDSLMLLSDPNKLYTNENKLKNTSTQLLVTKSEYIKPLEQPIILFRIKPILEANTIIKHSLIGRPPMQTSNKSVDTFQLQLFSKESSISIRYKLTQFNSLLVQFQRTWIYIKQNIQNIIVELFKFIQLQLIEARITISHLIQQLMQLVSSQGITGFRTISNGIDNLFDGYYIWRMKHSTAKHFKNVYDITPIDSSSITQAYVLNKIWQSIIESTPNLSWVKQQWTSENALQDYLQTQLVDQGILNCQEPNKLTQANWNKWLEFFPQYTPSSNIWLNVIPSRYRSEVNLYWKYCDNVDSKHQLSITSINANNKIEQSNGLKYHTPLLQKLEKLSKRWKMYHLYRRYTSFVNNINAKRFSTETILSDELNQLNYVNENIVQNSVNKTEDTISSREPIEWGFTRTRLGRFSPYLTLSQSHSNNSIDDIDTEDVETLGLFAILQTYKEFNKKTNFTSFSVDHKLNKQESSAAPKIDHKLDSQLVSTNLTQRTCFEPMYASKLKSKLLKERFKNLLNAARLSILATKSGVTTDTTTFLSSSMQRDLSILTEDLNTHKDINEGIEISEETKQDAYSKAMRNSVLFKQNLQNWRLKIMDDQIFMYNMVSPILRLSNREHNNYILNLCNCLLGQLSSNLVESIVALTPEDILLPTSSRELRVLDCLDLTAGPNDYQSVSNHTLIKNKTNSILVIDKILQNKDKLSYSKLVSKIPQTSKPSYIIKRFLWPTYRLEDLACMNRFWLSSGNQSRFSAFRISMYPSMFE